MSALFQQQKNANFLVDMPWFLTRMMLALLTVGKEKEMKAETEETIEIEIIGVIGETETEMMEEIETEMIEEIETETIEEIETGTIGGTEMIEGTATIEWIEVMIGRTTEGIETIGEMTKIIGETTEIKGGTTVNEMIETEETDRRLQNCITK